MCCSLIKADTEALQQAFFAVSEKLYQQAGAQAGGPDMGGAVGGESQDGGQGSTPAKPNWSYRAFFSLSLRTS